MLILSLRNKRVTVPILFTYNAVDFVFVFSGFVLITLNFLNSSLLESEILKYCFSFVLLFILPGWIVVRFLKIDDKFHKIPILVISFSISFGLTSIIYTILLIFMAEPSGLIISITYTALSLIPITLRHTVNKRSDKRIFVRNRKKDYNLIEIITLVWIVSFFVYILLHTYPEIVNTPGHDIVRHYAYLSTTDGNADLFRSPYPWFHLSLGALNDASDSEMWIFQTGNAFVSFIVILAFYSMAKAYLYKFNKYAHLLSTIIFTGFSGLGWIFYYQNIQPFTSFDEQIGIFYSAFVATYYDIGLAQSQWLWIWFRPLTIDFTLTLALLFLMRTENLNRLTYLTLSSLFIVTLSLVHFPGLILFVLIIFFLAIFVPKIRLRTKDMALSLIISLPISALMFISYITIFGDDNIPFASTHLIIMEGISIGCLLLLIYTKRLHILISLNYKRVISVVLVISGILFIYWLTNTDSIKDDISQILGFPGGLYSVPLYIFPVLLGLAGFLSIPILVIIMKNDRKNPLVIFPIVFIAIFIIGKIISYVIINFQDADYWERRVGHYLWITVSILSPIAIIKIINYINSIKPNGKNFAVVKSLIPFYFIFFLVMGSMMSSFLSPQYQRLSNSYLAMSDNETALLDEVLKLDPHSTILSATERSKSLADYQLFNHNVGYYRDQMWPSSSPELPMNILNGLNSTAIIYLSNQDMVKITENGYDNAYMASHVLENAPEIKKNSTFGKIIQIPRLSPPTSSSDMVLILPNTISSSQYYAYDILSLGQYNFTTALLSDIPTIKNAKILVAPNEAIANQIIDFRNDLDLNFENLIILNLDGYGQIGQIEGQHIDPRLSHTDSIERKYFKDNWQDNLVVLTREYDNPMDLSEYDYFKVSWVSPGKNHDYAVEFSSNSNGTIRYYLDDSLEGPKQILLPMDLTTDIVSGHDNIYIQTDGVNNTFWSNISKISFLALESSMHDDASININDSAFLSALKADNIKMISSNDTIRFNQSSMIIPSTYPSSYKSYSTFDNNIPFILQKTEPSYNIYYMNVFPLLQNFHDNNFSPAEMYTMYGKVMDWLGIDIPVYKSMEKSHLDLVTGGIAAFRNGIFTGDVTIESPSSTIQTNTGVAQISVDGNYSEIDNLSRILPLNVDHVEIKSNNSTMSGIYGFYTMSIFPHRTIIDFTGNPTVLSLTYEKDELLGDTFVDMSDDINDGVAQDEEILLYGNNITIGLNNAEVLSRQPKVMVDGVSNFSKFYSYGELNDKLRALNSYLDITGKSSFDTKYADEFILVENAQLGGKFETGWTKDFRDNANINLPKIDNLLKIDTLSYTLLLVLLGCLYNIYITKRLKSWINKHVKLEVK